MSLGRKNREMSADDKMVWRRVAETVKPLPPHYDSATFTELLEPQAETAPPVYKMPSFHPVKNTHKPMRALPDLDVGHMPGLDKRTSQRMTRGSLAIEGRIDLHGLTREQAQHRLLSYLSQAFEQGKRTILVITGKGQMGTGVLKSEVPRWMNLPSVREKILGFSYAQPKDGGDGALYVLMKRHRT